VNDFEGIWNVAVVVYFKFLSECLPNSMLESLEYGGKAKAIPLQDWTGPEGSRRVRFLDFKTIGT